MFSPNSKLKTQNSYRPSVAALFSLIALLIGFTAFFALPSDASAAVIRRAPNNFGLVGYWSFDDARGGTATDFSGNGNNGTLKNMDPATDWVGGTRGSALEFAGNQPSGSNETNKERVEIPDDPSLKPTTEWAITGWIYKKKLDQTNNGAALLWKGNEDKFSVEMRNKGLRINTGDAGWAAISSSDIAADEWVHIAAVYDDSSGSGELKLYLNGELDKSKTGIAQPNHDNDPIYIGERGDHYEHSFIGKIDEVRLYNRALSASEVKDLYNAGGYAKRNATADALYPDKLVSHWTMDGPDISGSTVKDVHGSNDGTKNGDPVARSGRLGQALEFDGSDDYINAGADSTHTFGDENMSFSTWMKSTAGGFNSIITQGQGVFGGTVNIRYVFSMRGGKAFIEVDDESTLSTCKSNTVINDGVWHKIVGLRDTSSDELRLYIDGVLDKTCPDNTGSISAADGELIIGKAAWNDNGFDGRIDDARIYDAALSADEISRLYTATKPDTVNSSQNEKLTNGLVGMWSFDGADVNLNDSSSEVKDVSSNSNHGDAKNGASPAVGRIGQAYEFDGSDDLVYMGTPSDVKNQKFTVSAWVNADTWSSRDDITSWAYNGFHLTGIDNGYPRLWLHLDGTWDYIDGPNKMPTGEWHFLTGVWDGDEQSIWLDGKKVNSRSDRSGSIPYNEGALQVGAYADTDGTSDTNNPFNGKIDNVRVYDRALSADEVQRLYDLGR